MGGIAIALTLTPHPDLMQRPVFGQNIARVIFQIIASGTTFLPRQIESFGQQHTISSIFRVRPLKRPVDLRRVPDQPPRALNVDLGFAKTSRITIPFLSRAMLLAKGQSQKTNGQPGFETVRSRVSEFFLRRLPLPYRVAILEKGPGPLRLHKLSAASDLVAHSILDQPQKAKKTRKRFR